MQHNLIRSLIQGGKMLGTSTAPRQRRSNCAPEHARTRQFILHFDGQPIVYDIYDSHITLKKRRGIYHKCLVGYLPSGVRFEASYGPATAVEIR